MDRTRPQSVVDLGAGLSLIWVQVYPDLDRGGSLDLNIYPFRLVETLKTYGSFYHFFTEKNSIYNISSYYIYALLWGLEDDKISNSDLDVHNSIPENLVQLYLCCVEALVPFDMF